MMLHHLVGWLRTESRRSRGQKRWAKWIGRNWARVSYGFRVEPTWLELNRFEVPIAGLPPPFAGFRIAQLSDFHGGRLVTPSYLAEAVELAQSQDPHLVALTGDFIHRGFKYIDGVAETLGRLKSPFGVYAVLGNHDYSVRNALGFRRFRHLHRAVSESLTARGIQVLKNDAVLLQKDGAILQLIGINDLWSREVDLDRAYCDIRAGFPCVVLAHNPCTIEHLNGQRCDLMLSGHTHGGQVYLPGIGRPTLSKRARRFAAGMYRFRDSHLYVNKGVGFGFRFRYGVRPEVAILTLQPAP